MGTALVTGSGIRVGRAIALELARMGYAIALHYNRSAAEAEATRQEILELGVACELFPFDLQGEPDAGRLVDQVSDRLPDLKVLVNSASTYDAATIAQTTPELLEKQFKVNFQAPFFLIRRFSERCDRGCVVNIIDNKIAFNQYPFAAYLLAKKSLAELTKLAALEFAPNLRVNGLAPGMVLPIASRSPEFLTWLTEGVPLKRSGNLDDLTHALRFLIENDFVTGQILTLDGGEAIATEGRNAPSFEAQRPSSSPPGSA
jgi:pteridine reductase